MARFKFKIDYNKLQDDVNREIKRAGGEAIDKFSPAEKKNIAAELMDIMKEQILKGISPIAGWGKFPAYKAVAAAAKLRKAASRSKSKSDRAKNLRASLRSRASDIKRKGYPASVRGQFPEKTDTPVNLYLSGKFLTEGLEMRPTDKGFEIGFWVEPYTKYEEGHRTGGKKGVNDQPQRPIIPDSSEEFSPSVYTRLVDSVRKSFAKLYGAK